MEKWRRANMAKGTARVYETVHRVFQEMATAVAVSSDWGLRLHSAYGVPSNASNEGDAGDCALARKVLRGVVSSSALRPAPFIS